MKYLVVGLGNPGLEYENTRHNVGFKVLDKLADNANWENVKHGHLLKITYKGRILVLLKPNTYMNLSGKAVSYWLQSEKIKPGHLLVITDDLALPTGKLRLKLHGSSGGHNGLKSIEESIQTQQFSRLRFGIGNNFEQGRQINFVLGTWTEIEMPVVTGAIDKAAEAVKMYVTAGPGATMTAVNIKS